jgi:hypothetical protein
VSKINLNNYEAFMLDYLEGNLSHQDILALKAFAVLHPELELNFDDELVVLGKEQDIFEGKQHLKADFSDELIIGYLENVLEGKERIEAEKLAKTNSVFKHELELYKKTIAVADTEIVFENKEKLKRRAAIIFFPQSNLMRIAAALLLLLGLWFIVSRVLTSVSTSSTTGRTELAKKESLPITTSTITNNVVANDNKVVRNDEKLVAKSSNVKNSSAITKKEKEINTSTVAILVPDKKEEPQLADRNSKELEPFVNRDTNTVLMANNSSQEKLFPKYVIEEGDDDEPVVAKPKSRLWNLASGVFKGLNKRGIENVNSIENNNEILIGALTISKPN